MQNSRFFVHRKDHSGTLGATGGECVKRQLKIALSVLGALVAAGIVYGLWRQYHGSFSLLLESTTQAENAIASLRDYGPLEVVLFFGLLVLMCCIPGAPSSVVAIFTGVCLGDWAGFLVSAAGLTVGNLVQSAVLKLLADRRDQEPTNWLYQSLVNMKHPRLGLLIGYAVPMIPTMLVNVASVRLRVSERSHALVCLLGSTLVAALYAFGGDALIRGNRRLLITLIIVFAALSVLIVVIRKDRQRRRSEN